MPGTRMALKKSWINILPGKKSLLLLISPVIRRTALAHGLLAFAINTFVVALTINLIAGLTM